MIVFPFEAWDNSDGQAQSCPPFSERSAPSKQAVKFMVQDDKSLPHVITISSTLNHGAKPTTSHAVDMYFKKSQNLMGLVSLP